MTDINQLGLVRTNHCPNCEAQAAGMSRFTKAEEDALRSQVKFVSAKYTDMLHEKCDLQMENARLRDALSWAEKVDPDLVFAIRVHAACGAEK